ncbi:YCF48-related protein [Flavobacterium limnophilum]|uniref:T9SS type A sorting domain-containing protein n=1 Tax=Flavobacterium limnophilum TaxID=3003262 RepID=UPI0024822F9B|nr:YCF48-related protein [Flavobacterium limnophilum]
MKNFTLMLALLISGLTMNSLNAQDSWTLQTNPVKPTAEVGKIQFVSANEGWISISPGGLLHTIDGGATWVEKMLHPTDIISSLIDPGLNLSFINPSTGWVLKSFGNDPFNSNGVVVYKTTDGGINWESKILSQTVGDTGIQIQFFDTNNGYATIYNFASDISTSLKTNDGGNNWTPVPSSGFLGILYFMDPNNGWAISSGPNAVAPHKIYQTTNGGVNWTPQYTDNTPGGFLAIQFTDLNHGWVVGQNGKIIKTNNGGTDWIEIVNSGITADYKCKSLYFLNATTGWIGTSTDGPTNITYVLHTTDGGASWSTQDPLTYNPYSIFFWDENTGWLTSDDNKIAHYSNPLGIKENLVSKYLTIYPNPNSGTFYFNLKKTDSKIQIEILNLSGQKIYEASKTEKQTSNEINFAPQSKGVYLIKINDGENSYSEKIIFQ